MTFAMPDGATQVLDLRKLADRNIRPSWVRTIHSNQGATADRMMAPLESFRANTVDAESAYVAISRRGSMPLPTPTAAPRSPMPSASAMTRIGAINEDIGLAQAEGLDNTIA